MSLCVLPDKLKLIYHIVLVHVGVGAEHVEGVLAHLDLCLLAEATHK